VNCNQYDLPYAWNDVEDQYADPDSEEEIEDTPIQD
jgi:hypothetical protein